MKRVEPLELTLGVEEVVGLSHDSGVHDGVEESSLFSHLLGGLFLFRRDGGDVVVKEFTEQGDGGLGPDGIVPGGEETETGIRSVF